MNLKRITINAGLSIPTRILHISDTHLSYADERDDERKNTLAEHRKHIFEITPDDSLLYLREAVETSKQTGAFLVNTGDLIDFVSERNLEIAREEWPIDNSLFVAGNHEYSLYVGEALEDEAYKAKSFDKVQSCFNDNLRFQSRVVGDVNIIGLDDVYYHFQPNHGALLEAEIAKGLPIILCMHAPLYTPELFHEEMVVHGEKYSGAVGCPEPLMRDYPEYRYVERLPTREDIELIEYIKAQPQIKAILAGHLHWFHESRLTPKLPQFIAGGHYCGEGLDITAV